ncbi:DUF1330 domain-containing protein [Sphingopyxis sp. BSNA05]|uniref:DUF1330 domain-containing protein n=1 Tax=Sphingopyxis sp. BSNA05 TaxID=1236614 RepID=UPI00156493CE|nr:DUF1330 domain-containing protein [Sphingopyxis sp. BSNA05]NRD90161.1 DUF1330 domain-containing protein [Sphingopyxis sp. BSNA05]|tara:strand:- start:1524 stop:1820 length:297 start_codon:yes stop_codon:yes gene_type:complete
MTAYLLGKLQVQHWDWYREYSTTTEPLVAEYGGRYLVKGGNAGHLEGDEPVGDATVLIEFPDRETLLAWYDDPRYAPMRELRRKSGVDCNLMIVDGFE